MTHIKLSLVAALFATTSLVGCATDTTEDEPGAGDEETEASAEALTNTCLKVVKESYRAGVNTFVVHNSCAVPLSRRLVLSNFVTDPTCRAFRAKADTTVQIRTVKDVSVKGFVACRRLPLEADG